MGGVDGVADWEAKFALESKAEAPIRDAVGWCAAVHGDEWVGRVWAEDAREDVGMFGCFYDCGFVGECGEDVGAVFFNIGSHAFG